MRQIIYVKYNRTRSEKFQLKTAIVRENGALSVEKTALTEAGAGHMGSFWEKYQMIREQNPRIRFLEPEFKDGGKTVCFRYLEGETLADALADRIHMGQIPYEELEAPLLPARALQRYSGLCRRGWRSWDGSPRPPTWTDYLKIS